MRLTLVIILLLNASRAWPATTNAAASYGPSVAGDIAQYADTSGQRLQPVSSLTNLNLVTPTVTVPGGYHSGAILTPWVGTNNAVSLQWKKPPQVWEFTSGSFVEWASFSFNSGSGSAGVGSDGIENGYYSGTTGALTNGGGGIRLDTTSFFFATNSIALAIRVKTPTSLSSAVDAYELIVGFGDATGDAEPVDGAYFYYTHTVSNGVWCAKTSSNSNRTFASGAASTPPTVAITTIYDLLVEGNMNGVNFWVSSDLGATYQWIGYSSSNIPTSSTRWTGANVYIRKVGGSTGTNARIFYFGRAVYWPY